MGPVRDAAVKRRASLVPKVKSDVTLPIDCPTMNDAIRYFLSPQSPWTYLGHDRFAAIAARAGARIEVLPIDLGKLFPLSGGLPLAKRAPQRQAYRLVELKRFAEHLGLPLTLRPKHFPVPGDAAPRLLAAVDLHDGSGSAMGLAGAMLRAVWADERDIADPAVLAALLEAQRLPVQRLDDAAAPAAVQRFEAATQRAIDAGVFGVPTYAVGGELFWGQDRLDFLERRLAAATAG